MKTPKEKSISEILDTAFNSDHTNGSHADDPSDKRPCYCHNRQYAEQALTAREASIRKDERKLATDDLEKIYTEIKPKDFTEDFIKGYSSAIRDTYLNQNDRIKQIERG